VSLVDLGRYEMAHARDLDALCALVQDNAGAVLLAGGTDFFPVMSQSALATDKLPLVIDISRMPELRSIAFDGKTLRIGAAATYLEIQRHPAVVEHAPLLVRMSLDVGGPTIQGRGTLGGNLATASPAADGVAAIAAFDPVIEVRSTRGSRRIPMAALQTGYKKGSRAADEIIVAVELDVPPAGYAWQWRKVGTRAAQAISKVALAGVATVEGGTIRRCSLAIASVAPVTALMPATRALAQGAELGKLDEAAIRAAVQRDIAPIDDLRSTRDYRQHCAESLVLGFFRQLGATSF
jgi:xanthine dehydrogenase small subunit